MSDMIVKDHEIETAWWRADFGPYWNNRKRELVVQAVLKRACGYHQGHTSRRIATELGLIGNGGKLTKKGKQFLWQELGSNL